MNPLPVSARRLCHRTCRTTDGLTRDACFLPFFDGESRVKWVMLLTDEPGRIYFVPWRPGLFRVPLWGPIRLATDFTRLRQITDEDGEAIQALWHFDPWWMLNANCYVSHWAVDLLKGTNCAGRLSRNVRMIHFRRDLSRPTWVTILEKDGTTRTSWQLSLLPAPPVPPAPETANKSSPTWHFDPIWRRWTGG